MLKWVRWVVKLEKIENSLYEVSSLFTPVSLQQQQLNLAILSKDSCHRQCYKEQIMLAQLNLFYILDYIYRVKLCDYILFLLDQKKKFLAALWQKLLDRKKKKKRFITSSRNQPSFQTLPSLGGVFLVSWWIIRNLSWCSHKYFPSKTGKKEKGAKAAIF